MTIPPAIVLAVIAVIVAAQTRLHAVVFGQMFSCPLLGLIAAIMVLLLAASVLVLLHLVIRDLRPVTR